MAMITTPWLYLFPLVTLAVPLILRLLTPRGISGVPALPNPKPIVGDLFTLIDAFKRLGGLGARTEELVKTYGPIFQLRIFSQRLLVVCDHKTAITISQDRSGAYDSEETIRNAFKLLIPQGMLSFPAGPEWKHHRRIMGPAMSNRYLSSMAHHVEACVDELLDLWRVKAELGGEGAWEAAEDLENATLNTIWSIGFGASAHSNRYTTDQLAKRPSAALHHKSGTVHFAVERHPIAISAAYTMKVLDNYSSMPYPYFKSLYNRLFSREYATHRARLDREFTTAIARSHERAESEGHDSLALGSESTVDLMIGKGGGVDRDGLTDQEIKDELLTYILAGSETTATALAWGVKFLAAHPEIQIKLRRHIQSATGGAGAADDEASSAQLGMDDLTPEKTPYLEAVVHEVLRLGRVSIGYARTAQKDVVVQGHAIPKGTSIIFFQTLGLEESPGWSLPSTRPDKPTGGAVPPWQAGTAYTFSPERWLDPQGRFDAHAGPSAPFGNGHRTCFGRNLALAELRVFIARINQAFFIERPKGQAAGDGWESREQIMRHPKECLIRPVLWENVKTSGGA